MLSNNLYIVVRLQLMIQNFDFFFWTCKNFLTPPCCNGLFQQEDEKKRKEEERKQTIAQKNEAERKRKEREVKMSHNNLTLVLPDLI